MLLLPMVNVKEGMSNLNNDTVDNTPWLTALQQVIPNPSSPASYKTQTAPKDMFFFKNTSFKPECCPATYSTSVVVPVLMKNKENL